MQIWCTYFHLHAHLLLHVPREPRPHRPRHPAGTGGDVISIPPLPVGHSVHNPIGEALSKSIAIPSPIGAPDLG